MPVAPDGRFLIALRSRRRAERELVATLGDGRRGARARSTVAPRAWDISRLNTLPKYPGAAARIPATAPARTRPDQRRARDGSRDADGWRQHFLWPVTGRISTLFGSQRIYKNGEAGSYHSGIDIARPTGTPVLAPADGVVILAADHPFTLEGNLLMIDHGMGLNSAFLHLSRIDVQVGEHVRRGQPIGAGRHDRPRDRAASPLGPEMARRADRSAARRRADAAITIGWHPPALCCSPRRSFL